MNTPCPRFMPAIAFIAAIWAGVYLCLHDFPVLGGRVCILTFLGNWNTLR